MARRLERDFQKHLVDRIEHELKNAFVLKNDSSYIQGIPDLLVLFRNMWATLEVKRSLDEGYEPNQEYYIAEMNAMSFSAMICPENEEEVLHALFTAFRTGRLPRLPQR